MIANIFVKVCQWQRKSFITDNWTNFEEEATNDDEDDKDDEDDDQKGTEIIIQVSLSWLWLRYPVTVKLCPSFSPTFQTLNRLLLFLKQAFKLNLILSEYTFFQ
jgi:hypothetical protein